MSAAEAIVSGNPTPEEAAAIVAAVQLLTAAGPTQDDPRPWAYRSAWRRAAIDEGVQRV